jgi:hypothetical protein
MSDTPESTERKEVHHFNHTESDRDVSVEISQGQSGKVGFTVKAYGASVAEAFAKAKDGVESVRDYLADEGEEG